MAIRGKSKKLFEFLKTKKQGNAVTIDDIIRVTGYEKKSFETYVQKNKYVKFLEGPTAGPFQVLLNGAELTEKAFDQATTQVSSVGFRPAAGIVLKGEKDRFTLVEPLGSGAVGHVWKATTSAARQSAVAVKIMLPRQDLLDPDKIDNVRERFVRESKNGQKLDSEFIIDHLDYGEVEGTPFLAMELAEKSAKDLLKDVGGRFPLRDTLPIIGACVEALAYLHEDRHVHRDVKPANVLRRADGSFLLADLGIVRWSDFNPAFTEAGTITFDAVQLGSLKYMAPEQRQRPHDADGASDIYALGVTWYEFLTGQALEPTAAVMQDFAEPCEEQAIARLIRQMVKYRSEDRPSLPDVRSAIEKLRQEEASPAA